MSETSAKTAIVTRVSDPVLAAAAIMLAASGVQVVACDLNSACPGELADADQGTNAILPFSGDLALREEAARLVALTLDRFGRIDMLINGPVLPDRLERPFADNALLDAGTAALRPWTNCLEAVEPLLASNGRIVSVVTSAGQYRTGYFLPQGQTQSAAPEAMANGAVLGLTRQLALELAPRGIRVNAVVMGLLEGSPETELMNAEERRYVLEEISLGRLGTAEEVAGVVAFLASEASNYVTGDAIDVNGGWWMS
jgi:3-oxoacyl-[acyl-carrier protein] reductase